MVEILCPHCSEEIELDDEDAEIVDCPYCQRQVKTRLMRKWISGWNFIGHLLDWLNWWGRRR